MINFILRLYFFVRASVNIVSNEKRHYGNKRHMFEELVLLCFSVCTNFQPFTPTDFGDVFSFPTCIKNSSS